MSSLVIAVFKAAIGLLVNKGRDKAAEGLKESDVTDQKFRGMIVREIDDIRSKLNGSKYLFRTRKYLLPSISFFEEGIEFLYEVFEKARSRSEYGAGTTQAAAGDEVVSLAKGMIKLELNDLDESAARALANAKKRFGNARKKATTAFANEMIRLSDRLLAMQYRVMATILENLENPTDAVPACRVCIKELNSLSAVKRCFTDELKNSKGFWTGFSKDERLKLIATTCHVNRVIYDVTLMLRFGNQELSENSWPCVDIGEKQVDPLRDVTISHTLQKQGMEHCCVTPWSFGQECEEEEHKLKYPRCIASNADRELIVADWEDISVKVFSSSGNFLLSFKPETDDADTDLYMCTLDVATDVNSNTYILVGLVRPGAEEYKWEVQLYNSTADLQHKFPVRGVGWDDRLTVSKNKVLVWTRTGDKQVVDVYEHDGRFVCSFGEGILKDAGDITAAFEDRVMIVDRGDSCVHVFTEEGKHLSKFNINIEGDLYFRIAVHPAGEHVVVAGLDQGTVFLLVAVYTKDGEFVRRIQPSVEEFDLCLGVTVTMDGRIAVAAGRPDNSKVLVF